MKVLQKLLTALLLAALTISCGMSAGAESFDPKDSYKKEGDNNPLSPLVFCADPTAVEYKGRLYVYGTNDHQQYEEKGADIENTYEKIVSLVVFSTDDMVNWEYHGEINVKEIAPWIANSWAPSVVSRVEKDGLTHFYLYFSNSGMGTGVITATDPLGPWTDPLGNPLVSYKTPGLKDCPTPFDPGAVIDENGVGWLAFGGGKAQGGTDEYPGSARIVRLGEDMISFDSDFTEIPAPYFFEASELNFINGWYVYTYCSDWSRHLIGWVKMPYDVPAPGSCSMICMKTKTPLDPDSWKMVGEVLKNPGELGFDYSNNHTHMHKYKGKWYIIYHTLALKKAMGIAGGYRSLCVDEIAVDEDTVTITSAKGSRKGVAEPADSKFSGSGSMQINNCYGIHFDTSDPHSPAVVSDKAGAWIKAADISCDTAVKPSDTKKITFAASVRGKGTIRLYTGKKLLAAIKVDSPKSFGTVSADINRELLKDGTDLYMVFDSGDMSMKSYGFKATGRDIPPALAAGAAVGVAAVGCIIAGITKK